MRLRKKEITKRCFSVSGAFRFLCLDAAALAVFASCGKETEPLSPCYARAVFGDPSQSPYVLPYPVGAAYRVLQSYCTLNGSHFNQLAYDFAMDIGTQITTARAGIVIQVVNLYLDTDMDQSHFSYIFVRHDDGSGAFYAHVQLDSIQVRVNDRVEIGQHIALSGNCGTPVADLHFGVYRSWPIQDGNDVAVNFRNAQGALDSRGGLQRGEIYLALPY